MSLFLSSPFTSLKPLFSLSSHSKHLVKTPKFRYTFFSSKNILQGISITIYVIFPFSYLFLSLLLISSDKLADTDNFLIKRNSYIDEFKIYAYFQLFFKHIIIHWRVFGHILTLSISDFITIVNKVSNTFKKFKNSSR